MKKYEEAQEVIREIKKSIDESSRFPKVYTPFKKKFKNSFGAIQENFLSV
jgi:hypothetical protein